MDYSKICQFQVGTVFSVGFPSIIDVDLKLMHLMYQAYYNRLMKAYTS